MGRACICCEACLSRFVRFGRDRYIPTFRRFVKSTPITREQEKIITTVYQLDEDGNRDGVISENDTGWQTTDSSDGNPVYTVDGSKIISSAELKEESSVLGPIEQESDIDGDTETITKTHHRTLFKTRVETRNLLYFNVNDMFDHDETDSQGEPMYIWHRLVLMLSREHEDYESGDVNLTVHGAYVDENAPTNWNSVNNMIDQAANSKNITFDRDKADERDGGFTDDENAWIDITDWETLQGNGEYLFIIEPHSGSSEMGRYYTVRNGQKSSYNFYDSRIHTVNGFSEIPFVFLEYQRRHKEYYGGNFNGVPEGIKQYIDPTQQNGSRNKLFSPGENWRLDFTRVDKGEYVSRAGFLFRDNFELRIPDPQGDFFNTFGNTLSYQVFTPKINNTRAGREKIILDASIYLPNDHRRVLDEILDISCISAGELAQNSYEKDWYKAGILWEPPNNPPAPPDPSFDGYPYNLPRSIYAYFPDSEINGVTYYHRPDLDSSRFRSFSGADFRSVDFSLSSFARGMDTLIFNNDDKPIGGFVSQSVVYSINQLSDHIENEYDTYGTGIGSISLPQHEIEFKNKQVSVDLRGTYHTSNKSNIPGVITNKAITNFQNRLLDVGDYDEDRLRLRFKLSDHRYIPGTIRVNEIKTKSFNRDCRSICHSFSDYPFPNLHIDVDTPFSTNETIDVISSMHCRSEKYTHADNICFPNKQKHRQYFNSDHAVYSQDIFHLVGGSLALDSEQSEVNCESNDVGFLRTVTGDCTNVWIAKDNCLNETTALTITAEWDLECSLLDLPDCTVADGACVTRHSFGCSGDNTLPGPDRYYSVPLTVRNGEGSSQCITVGSTFQDQSSLISALGTVNYTYDVDSYSKDMPSTAGTYTKVESRRLVGIDSDDLSDLTYGDIQAKIRVFERDFSQYHSVENLNTFLVWYSPDVFNSGRILEYRLDMPDDWWRYFDTDFWQQGIPEDEIGSLADESVEHLSPVAQMREISIDNVLTEDEITQIQENLFNGASIVYRVTKEEDEDKNGYYTITENSHDGPSGSGNIPPYSEPILMRASHNLHYYGASISEIIHQKPNNFSQDGNPYKIQNKEFPVGFAQTTFVKFDQCDPDSEIESFDASLPNAYVNNFPNTPLNVVGGNLGQFLPLSVFQIGLDSPLSRMRNTFFESTWETNFNDDLSNSASLPSNLSDEMAFAHKAKPSLFASECQYVIQSNWSNNLINIAENTKELTFTGYWPGSRGPVCDARYDVLHTYNDSYATPTGEKIFDNYYNPFSFYPNMSRVAGGQGASVGYEQSYNVDFWALAPFDMNSTLTWLFLLSEEELADPDFEIELSGSTASIYNDGNLYGGPGTTGTLQNNSLTFDDGTPILELYFLSYTSHVVGGQQPIWTRFDFEGINLLRLGFPLFDQLSNNLETYQYDSLLAQRELKYSREVLSLTGYDVKPAPSKYESQDFILNTSVDDIPQVCDPSVDMLQLVPFFKSFAQTSGRDIYFINEYTPYVYLFRNMFSKAALAWPYSAPYVSGGNALCLTSSVFDVPIHSPKYGPIGYPNYGVFNEFFQDYAQNCTPGKQWYDGSPFPTLDPPGWWADKLWTQHNVDFAGQYLNPNVLSVADMSERIWEEYIKQQLKDPVLNNIELLKNHIFSILNEISNLNYSTTNNVVYSFSEKRVNLEDISITISSFI